MEWKQHGFRNSPYLGRHYRPMINMIIQYQQIQTVLTDVDFTEIKANKKD